MPISKSLYRDLHTTPRKPSFELRDPDGKPVPVPAYGSEFKTVNGFYAALQWKQGTVSRGEEKWGTRLDEVSTVQLVHITTGKVRLTLTKQADNTFRSY